MSKLQFALLIDVDNVPVELSLFESVINQVELHGNIIYGKVYGFSDKRHNKLSHIISARGFDTASTMRGKTRKSQLDLRLVVDAVKIACQNPSINAFCIVSGEGDLVPFIVTLKSLGKYTIGGFLSNSDNDAVCDKLINVRETGIMTLQEKGFNAPPVKRKPREQDESILSELDELMSRAQPPQPASADKKPEDVLNDLESLVKSLLNK